MFFLLWKTLLFRLSSFLIWIQGIFNSSALISLFCTQRQNEASQSNLSLRNSDPIYTLFPWYHFSIWGGLHPNHRAWIVHPLQFHPQLLVYRMRCSKISPDILRHTSRCHANNKLNFHFSLFIKLLFRSWCVMTVIPCTDCCYTELFYYCVTYIVILL